MGGVKAGSQDLFVVATRDTSHSKPLIDQAHGMARTTEISTERVVLEKKMLAWHLLQDT